ncbi:MAG: methylenetetrahydrofolate--tRNA-(uracil(54)-C(5))-methyltransferase (FADH(2)-oxidizing) TrmFO [Oscillospiraceae bacterium]|jgi:methylenetetrahydrofolate--tRNA-(uracil-5-)-methyltransferase|nr:methylenetetrahydrofolate--tRNA-(uracil(54)-C(5))-methyltransferase (FADH(2)-oxidizing) TrmFO [Oscillospiraceae bacterium]
MEAGQRVTVIGAGLAGCEAAWLLANAGLPVTLCEQKPEKHSLAHKSPLFAELVCSNSLKAERPDSAAGLLKNEMRTLGSLCLTAADNTRVPAGGALAVNREEFAGFITAKIQEHPLIDIRVGEVTSLPNPPAIIATGPLTEGALYAEIAEQTGGLLSFYDAAAPIITLESVDFSRAFFASRYGGGIAPTSGETGVDSTRKEVEDGGYINCPFNKEEYERFYEALINAETATLHEFDLPGANVSRETQPIGQAIKPAVTDSLNRCQVYYEGCMPIEVLAKRGKDAIRFGPMKPVGLRDPNTGHRPWAVLQLRRENAGGTLYNLVGFQTNLKFGEQKRVFSLIPGLQNPEFARYGVMHRNSFLDSPRTLNPDLSLKNAPDVYFAGQITGVEGYMESAACGMAAAINLLRATNGQAFRPFPAQTMIGALLGYITDASVTKFQPMGANFGNLPLLEEHIRDKRQRYAALAERAETALCTYLKDFTFTKGSEPS